MVLVKNGKGNPNINPHAVLTVFYIHVYYFFIDFLTHSFKSLHELGLILCNSFSLKFTVDPKHIQKYTVDGTLVQQRKSLFLIRTHIHACTRRGKSENPNIQGENMWNSTQTVTSSSGLKQGPKAVRQHFYMLHYHDFSLNF